MGFAVKIYVEFIGWASEKAKRPWLWLEVPGRPLLKELFANYLVGVLGEEVANGFLNAFEKGLLRILINGKPVDDLNYILNDGDKVYLLPMAAGG